MCVAVVALKDILKEESRLSTDDAGGTLVIQQVAQGWLLQEDADRLVKQAEVSTVLLDSGAT
jgi:hypothetical protein